MAPEPVGIVDGNASERGELLSEVYGEIQEQGREFVDEVRNAGQSFVATVRDTISNITNSPQAQQQRQRAAGGAAPSTTAFGSDAIVTAPTQNSPVEKSGGMSWLGWFVVIVVLVVLFWVLIHVFKKNSSNSDDGESYSGSYSGRWSKLTAFDRLIIVSDYQELGTSIETPIKIVAWEYTMSLELNIDGDSLEAMINGLQLPTQDSSSETPSSSTSTTSQPRAVRPRGAPPRMVQEAQRRQAEEAERLARMNPNKKTKGGRGSQASYTDPVELPSFQSGPATRRVVVAGRVKYIPVNSSPLEMIAPASLPVIPPVSIEMPEAIRRIPASVARRASNSGVGSLRRASQAPQRAQRIPSFIAKKMNDEAKLNAIRSARSLNEVRRIKLAQEIEPSIGDDVRKYTLAQMRAVRAQQARDARQLNQNLRTEPQESAADKIKSDPNLSNLAKAIALKRLADRPRRNIALKREWEFVHFAY